MMDLFNRNRDGSKELEDLTGQWYASSPFRLIETEIRFATDEVARLVSPEVSRRPRRLTMRMRNRSLWPL